MTSLIEAEISHNCGI